MAEKSKYLFDNPANVQRILYLLYICCAILIILDFIIHRHLLHPWEGLLGFYAIYGFVGCVVLVQIAKWMRTFLMRDEDYYDRLELDRRELDGGDHVGR
ncbi:MAG: hypothetical protein ABR512_11495 [Desulfopila sp.]